MAVMVAIAVTVSETVSQKPDGCGTQHRCSWIHDLLRTPVGIIGSRAAGTEDDNKAGEEQTMEFLLHGTSSDEAANELFDSLA